MKKSILFLVLPALVAATACRKHKTTQQALAQPVIDEVDFPMSHNDKLAALGRVLFYDKNLSFNNSVACASCHQQSKAFCDNQQFSTGLDGHVTSRNSPSIFSRNGRMFWDGRASSPTDLALMPVKNHVEMKMPDLQALCVKLSKTGHYPGLFEQAFGSPVIDSSRMQQAIGEFLRNFNFSDSKFNRSQRGVTTLNAPEQLGRELFFGKAGCANCHQLNNPQTPGTGYGRTDHDDFFNIGLDEEYADRGRGEISRKPAEYGMFLLPVLLNVEHTAPYMHDGRFRTLDEVVEHYNSGVKNHPNLSFHLRDFSAYPGQNPTSVVFELDKNHDGMLDAQESQTVPPKRLHLTNDEKRHLVSFLRTLSDDRIFTDRRFSDPFVKQ